MLYCYENTKLRRKEEESKLKEDSNINTQTRKTFLCSGSTARVTTASHTASALLQRQLMQLQSIVGPKYCPRPKYM